MQTLKGPAVSVLSNSVSLMAAIRSTLAFGYSSLVGEAQAAVHAYKYWDDVLDLANIFADLHGCILLVEGESSEFRQKVGAKVVVRLLIDYRREYARL